MGAPGPVESHDGTDCEHKARTLRAPCYVAYSGQCATLVADLQVQISLHVSDREQISDLRSNAEHPRPEAAEKRVLAGIVGDLLIHIADKADEDLL